MTKKISKRCKSIRRSRWSRKCNDRGSIAQKNCRQGYHWRKGYVLKSGVGRGKRVQGCWVKDPGRHKKKSKKRKPTLKRKKTQKRKTPQKKRKPLQQKRRPRFSIFARSPSPSPPPSPPPSPRPTRRDPETSWVPELERISPVDPDSTDSEGELDRIFDVAQDYSDTDSDVPGPTPTPRPEPSPEPIRIPVYPEPPGLPSAIEESSDDSEDMEAFLPPIDYSVPVFHPRPESPPASPPPARPPSPVPDEKSDDVLRCPNGMKFCRNWGRRAACIDPTHSCAASFETYKLQFGAGQPAGFAPKPYAKKCKREADGGDGEFCDFTKPQKGFFERVVFGDLL